MTRKGLWIVGALLLANAAGCALPTRIGDSSRGPTPLPLELMQAGEQYDYRAPARDQVMGCVVVHYQIDRDGTPRNVQIQESHPAGYFDAEVLNLMQVIRFRSRARVENGARLFAFAPRGGNHSREAAASLCSPVPTHAELNAFKKETP